MSSISSSWEWIGDCRDEMLAYVHGSPMLLCCREVLWPSLSIGSVILILWPIIVNLNILLEGKTASCKVKAQEFLLGIRLDYPEGKDFQEIIICSIIADEFLIHDMIFLHIPLFLWLPGTGGKRKEMHNYGFLVHIIYYLFE